MAAACHMDLHSRIFITVITFYPGFMSPHLLTQYRQSLTFEFGDWHPPTFAFVWAIFNSIYPGPQWMLFIQVGGYWLILYLLMTSNDFFIYGLSLPILLFISPMMIGLIGVIWKDVHLAVAWGLAFTIVYYFFVRSTPIPWFALIASLVLVIYGSLIEQCLRGHGSVRDLLACGTAIFTDRHSYDIRVCGDCDRHFCQP